MRHTVAGYFFVMALLCIGLVWYSSAYPFDFSPSNVADITTKQVMGISTAPVRSPDITVAKVIDGDTIVTKDNQKVRYIGINAPEVGQPFATESTHLNKQLVEGKNVTLAFDTQKKDSHGRILAYVYVGNTLINAELVKNGLAVAEPIAPNTTHQSDILQAEQLAKQKCLGIWENTCVPQTNSCLKIHTIVFDAQGKDDQNENGEWVELTNTCPVAVDLSGWLIKDASASNSYTFGKVLLPVQKSLRLHSGCGINTTTDLYWQCPARERAVWNNTGDEAMLFDSHGKLLSVYKY